MLQELLEQLLIQFARKSSTTTKGTPRTPGALIELQGPSDRITHAGAIQISRFGLTPQPPMDNDLGFLERLSLHARNACSDNRSRNPRSLSIYA